MNSDFHFYATYLAALAAGWSEDEARTLGNASAFIDHYDIPSAKAVAAKAASFGLNIEPRFTFPAEAPDDWWADMLHQRFENSVWTVYHFVPGNKPTTADGPGYVCHEVKNWGSSDVGGKAAGESLTRPLGGVALTALDRLRAQAQKDLHLLGLSVHIFEDTWAHQNFSGRALKMNAKRSRLRNVQANRHGKWEAAGLNRINKGPQHTWQVPDVALGIPGHGRFGTVPDLAYLEWKYEPYWSDEWLIRNNPEIFLQAWEHAAMYMHAVRTDQSLSSTLNSPPAFDPRFRDVVERYVRTDMHDKWKKAADFAEFSEACMALWRQLAPDILGDVVYAAKDNWKREAAAASSRSELERADAYRFNEAAWVFWRAIWTALRDMGYDHTIQHFSEGANKVDYVVELLRQG